MQKISNDIIIKNKKASFEYQFLETFTAGMVLTGTEIKSIRTGTANLQESYCVFMHGELYVKSMHISKYNEGSYYNHDPLRDRKLLLQKRELRKLETKSLEKGIAIIPVRLFITKRGFAKLEIALAKGKKLFDKREDIKEKDIRREMERERF